MVLGINAIVDRLINYLLEKKKLIANDIQENTYIGELGLDSIEAWQLTFFIKDNFQADIDIIFLLQNPTIKEIANEVQKAIHQNSGSNKQDNLPPKHKNYLSPFQNRIWKLSHINNNSAFNIGAAFKIKGCIDRKLIVTALQKLFESHDVLRVYFVNDQENPTQIADAEVHPSIEYIDLSTSNLSDQQARLNHIKHNHINYIFDLENPSLCKLALVKLSPTEAEIFFIIHHIIADGWSLKILAEDFLNNYNTLFDGVKKTIIQTQHSFLEYASKSYLSYDSKAQLERAYPYLESLKNLQPIFPFDETFEKEHRVEGGEISIDISPDILSAAKCLIIEHQITLPSLFLSCFLLALYTYTAHSDFTVLMPVANRETKNSMNLVGLLANIIAVRNKINGRTSIFDFIKQVHTNFLIAYNNRFLPFDLVVEHLARNSWFRPSVLQLFFDYQKNIKIESDQLSLELSEISSGYARFYFCLSCKEGDQNINLDFTYSKKFFTENDVKSIADIFKDILQGILKGKLFEIDALLDALYQDLPKIVISANYTAEPIKDSLQFWLKKIGYNHHIRFTPYNHVIQGFLDSNSAFMKNSNGINVALLFLNESIDNRLVEPLIPQKDKKLILDREVYNLPNGMKIFANNRGEADFLYREIFQDNCYIKHGISLPENACVIDAGANIGVFTLYIKQLCKNAKVIAFEPIPKIFELLKANVELYDLSNVICINQGLSNIDGKKTFFHYPMSSLQSGYYTNISEDASIVTNVAINQIKEIQGLGKNASFDNEILKNRFNHIKYECSVLTLTKVIEQYDLKKIDLLKIDVEKSEMDVLNGIKNEDWDKIDQVVIEVHDIEGRLKKVASKLEKINFNLYIEQEELFKGSNIYTIYGKKIYNYHSPNQGFLKNERDLENHFNQLNTAIMTRHNDFKSPTIIGLDYNIENKAALSVVEKLKTELQNLNNNFNSLFFEDFVSSQRSYKISAKYDPYSFATADIPYTEEYFTFLGTVVARRIHSILSQTLSKVIVVDCDNTLWEGICGEGSLEEVRVLEKNIILQKFLLEQYAKGIILCLCSKNNENDVFKVFNTNQNMLVNLNHFITWRINWKRKSDNLLSLAEELNLGMDSFIFIDDSPIECAEVFSSLPQVMTFQFFDNIDELKYLLKNIWTLDKNRVGKEDKYRTEMYRQNIQRNKLKTAVTSFNSFIEDLQVHTQILSADIDYIPRIIQMLARINQFNLTLKKYSIPELQKLINSKDHFCYVINVSDKFGDYGTVGVLILKREGKRLTLDTFLISCRALGRGIEATMLYHAAKIAIQNNCHEIALYGVPSGRNIPALNFFNIIRKLSNDIKKEENLLIFTPQALLNIDLMIDYNNDLDSTKKQSIEITNIKRNPLIIEPNKVFNFIAKESFNIMNVVAEIHRQKIVSRSNLTSIYVKPRTHLEKQLVKVWEDVLKVKNIGINDNFFELGGHSLLATTIAGQLKKILGIEIPLSDMFNLLTVKELANHIESSMHKNTDSINSAFIIDSVAKKNFIIE